MATGNQDSPQQRTAPTFELKRFVWATPDRLELAGTFGGLQDTSVDAAPVLVVRAGDNVHRLPAVADTLDGPPEEGRVWQAAFAWQDAPVAFGVAELHLGGGLVVHLPEPSAKRLLSRTHVLEVQTGQEGERPAPDGGAAASVSSQVEVLAAQEEVREVRVALEQAEAELSRARDDLQAERERRAGDGERFRDGLVKVRESAEKALAEAQRARSGPRTTELETLRAGSRRRLPPRRRRAARRRRSASSSRRSETDAGAEPGSCAPRSSRRTGWSRRPEATPSASWLG